MSDVKTISSAQAADLFNSAGEWLEKPIPKKAIQVTDPFVIEQKGKELTCEPGDYLLLKENGSIQKYSEQDFLEKFKPLGL